MDIEAALFCGCRKRLAQLPVCSHTARHHQALEPGLLQCGERFDRQHVDRRVDKPSGKIRLGLFADIRATQLLHVRQHGRLQAAEAEIEVAGMQHGAWQNHCAGCAEFCQPRDFRAAWITEAEQLGGLVEGFSGRVVQRFAERLVDAYVGHAHQLRVATRYQQRNERKRRWLVDQQRRQQMPFKVVDADGGLVPRHGERIRDTGADQQRAR
jgi:hypothetical protein